MPNEQRFSKYAHPNEATMMDSAGGLVTELLRSLYLVIPGQVKLMK